MSSLSIHKIIYYIVALGIILAAVAMYFAQNNLETTYTELEYGWYYKMGSIGDACISIAAVLSFLAYSKYFPIFVSVCYILMIILVTLTSLPDIADIIKQPSIFYSTRGVGTFINFGMLFIAANTRYFQKILRIFYWVCIGFIIAGFINLGKVGIGADRQQYQYAILNFAVVLIWVFPFFFLQTYEEKRRNLINMIIFFIIFIFVLCTGSRSYMLIYAIFLLAKFKHQLSSKNGILIIIVTILVGAGVFLFIINSSVGTQMNNAFGILSERASEDSRSEQIVEFLGQWKSENFLLGVGPVKGWYWSIIGDYYYYLDNQLLFLGWWAGLPVLAIYLFLLLRTLFTRPEIKLYKDVQGIRLTVGLWILACLGLAIYINISSALYYHFLDIIMSYHLCKFTKIKDFDPEET